MSRSALFVALLLALCAGAPAKNIALLVAVGQFRDPALKTQQLLGTAPDLESMQHTLTERWGFAAGDVLALRDQDATHERILAEISALERRSTPGDTVLIYFSGHGTSAAAENNSFDLPYATGAWVPYDLDYSSVAAAQRTLIVGRRDLVPRLKRLDQGGRFVVVVSDSCYSGQVVRAFGETHSRTRFLPMVRRDLGVARVNVLPSARPPPPPYPYQHVVLLSGASDSETGADISSPQALLQAPTLDGRYHGAFTDAFLRLLNGMLLPGTFNYTQGRAALNAFLEQRNFAQHPQLLPALAEDPLDVGSIAFLGVHAAPPGAAGAGAAPAARNNSLEVRLDAVSSATRARIAGLSGVRLVAQGGDLVVQQRGVEFRLNGPAGDPISNTRGSDAAVVKRIAAQAWLKRALPTGSSALGLRAETDPGSRGNTFVQCESFVFEVRVQKPAFVMLLDLDAEGHLAVLYPTRPSERMLVPAGKSTALPGGDSKDRILVTPPFGTDQVTVLAFESQPAFFEELTGAQRFEADDPRARALAKGLANVAGAVGVESLAVHTYPGANGGLCGS